jgi:hypothetical protein
MPEIVRRRAAVDLTGVAVAAIAVAAALPWAHSGRASRSAFALARTADELGVVRGPLARAMFVALACLPAAAVLVWVAAAMRWHRLVAGLGAVAGLLTIVGVVMVWRAPVEVGGGVHLAAVAGVAALIGAGVVAQTERET